MRSNAAYSSYQQNSITVESPAKLIEMLYEGILRFTALAKRAMDEEDIEKKIYYVNRTTDIFTELLNSLDYKRGGGCGALSYGTLHAPNQASHTS